jgi:hypothetical protein
LIRAAEAESHDAQFVESLRCRRVQRCANAIRLQ